jgi:hypothetical protein
MEIIAPLGSVSIVKEREYCAALELIEGRRVDSRQSNLLHCGESGGD